MPFKTSAEGLSWMFRWTIEEEQAACDNCLQELMAVLGSSALGWHSFGLFAE